MSDLMVSLSDDGIMSDNDAFFKFNGVVDGK